MIESIFVIVKILGVIFFAYKAINLAGQVSDKGEVSALMGASLSLRTGNFAAKR